MPNPKIKFYVDILTWCVCSEVGINEIQNSPVFKQCDITYVPIFLGGLMKACGNTPPLTVKNKDKWINTERKRWASTFNIPISPTAPPGFPINTISIQRVLCALTLSHPASLISAIELFNQNFWVHYNEPTKMENLLALVMTIVGSEGEARSVLERSREEQVKGLLVKNTDEAFKEGAFGLPWFVATNSKGETERFWGVDHMGQLCDHLGLDRPGGKGWRSLL